MLKRTNQACTFTKPLTVTEALQSLAPNSSAISVFYAEKQDQRTEERPQNNMRRLRGVLEQPSPPGYTQHVVGK